MPDPSLGIEISRASGNLLVVGNVGTSQYIPSKCPYSLPFQLRCIRERMNFHGRWILSVSRCIKTGKKGRLLKIEIVGQLCSCGEKMGARRAAWGWMRNVNRSWSQFFHLFTKASAHHNSLWKIWTSHTSNYKFTWIGAQVLSWIVNYHSSPPCHPPPLIKELFQHIFFKIMTIVYISDIFYKHI